MNGKVIISLLLMTINVFAGVWFTDVRYGLQVAKKYKCPIVVFVYKNGCPYCEKSIAGFQYPPLRSILASKKIVPIAIEKSDIDSLKYLKIKTEMYPSYFLFSERGDLLTYPVKGFVTPFDMAKYLSTVIDQYQKVRKKRLGIK